MFFSMVTKTSWKTKKSLKSKVSTWNSEKNNVSEVVVEKNRDEHLETGVSVFTKTTNPRVVIQSEQVNDTSFFKNQNVCGHRFLKSVCLIILAIVLLMVFFLTLKTYNTVNELYLLLSN